MDLIAGLKLSSLLVLASTLVLLWKKPEILFSQFGETNLPKSITPSVDEAFLEKWCARHKEVCEAENAQKIELYYRQQLNGRLARLESTQESTLKQINDNYSQLREDISEIRKFVMDLKR